MGSSTVSIPRAPGFPEQDVPFSDDRVGFVDAPESGNRASRGAIIGILLGAGLWSVILVLAGVIKL